MSCAKEIGSSINSVYLLWQKGEAAVREILRYVHIVLAYLLALYALLMVFLPWPRHAKKLSQTRRIIRLASYLALFAFLIGGYLATPYFKTGQLWVFFKLALFVLLMGIMGGLGTRALKLTEAQMLQDQAADPDPKQLKIVSLFKLSQFIVIGLLFLMAYWKPM